jgi:hypothetical protein
MTSTTVDASVRTALKTSSPVELDQHNISIREAVQDTDPGTLTTESHESHSFFGAGGVTSGYSLEATYLPFESADSKEDITVLVSLTASGNLSDPLQTLSAGHSDTLSNINPQIALGAIRVDREISLADYQTLRDRLISIEEFSFEYDDLESQRNAGRAFAQLFRGAALGENVSEFLTSTPLGDLRVRQY